MYPAWLSPTRLTLVLVLLAAPSLAADRPPAATPPGSREVASLRVEAGIGAGNVGLAGRLGVELDYWLLPHLALGASAAFGTQAMLLGDGYDHWFVGPGVSLRTDPGGEATWFARAAAGVALGTYQEPGSLLGCGSCGPQHDFSGFGAALGGGWLTRVGSLDLGGSLALDLLQVELEGPRTFHTVTGNFILGFGGG